jgi:hypothetical protein
MEILGKPVAMKGIQMACVCDGFMPSSLWAAMDTV